MTTNRLDPKVRKQIVDAYRGLGMRPDAIPTTAQVDAASRALHLVLAIDDQAASQWAVVTDALKTIAHARDHMAQHGCYPDGCTDPDMMPDDYMAEVASEAYLGLTGEPIGPITEAERREYASDDKIGCTDGPSCSGDAACSRHD